MFGGFFDENDMMTAVTVEGANSQSTPRHLCLADPSSLPYFDFRARAVVAEPHTHGKLVFRVTRKNITRAMNEKLLW